MRGILFFDYDGTLVDEFAGVMKPTRRTLSAISQAKENGYLVILATGRTIAYLKSMPPVPFDGYITTNGAYGTIGDRELFNETIPSERVYRVMDYCGEHDIDCLLETQNVSYYQKEAMSEQFWERLLQFEFDPDGFRYLDRDSVPRLGVNKMFAMAEEQGQLQALRQEFERELEVIPLPWGCFADITDINMSKGVGVRKFYETLGVPLENTYAFGDGHNDYTMLESVGHGVAMGNHQPSLEQVAEYITGTVEEDGVEQAMKHYGIIR